MYYISILVLGVSVMVGATYTDMDSESLIGAGSYTLSAIALLSALFYWVMETFVDINRHMAQEEERKIKYEGMGFFKTQYRRIMDFHYDAENEEVRYPILTAVVVSAVVFFVSAVIGFDFLTGLMGGIMAFLFTFSAVINPVSRLEKQKAMDKIHEMTSANKQD